MFIVPFLYVHSDDSFHSDDPFASIRKTKMNQFLDHFHLKFPLKEAYQVMPNMILAKLHDITENDYSFEIKKFNHNSIATGVVRCQGKEIANVDIVTRRNPQDAMSFLAEWVTSSSMPLTLILQNYTNLENGCGELCFATSKNYDSRSGIMSHANGRFFFLRNGLIVRLINLSENCNVYAIANLLDRQIMKALKTIKGKGVVQGKDKIEQPVSITNSENDPLIPINFSVAPALPEDFYINELKKYIDIKNKSAEDYFVIAEIYYYGRKGISINKKKAREYYQCAYDLALVELQRFPNNYATMYIAGICVERLLLPGVNYLRYLQDAATGGYPPAEADMAFRYMKGIGVNTNFRQAYAYALKASEHGDMLGRAILGAYYLTIKKDVKRGIKFILESAEAGNPGGQYMLFRCLYYSNGVEKNIDLAMKILKMSADQGFPDSVSKWNNLKKEIKIQQ